jgi:hypothetical protein
MEVISQAAPTDWISPPRLEARLAIQTARKMRCPKGDKDDLLLVDASVVSVGMEISMEPGPARRRLSRVHRMFYQGETEPREPGMVRKAVAFDQSCWTSGGENPKTVDWLTKWPEIHLQRIG